MNKTKKGFGQELDLGNYEGRWSQEECNNHTKRGVFVKFSYMYIGDLDYSDEQLHNAAIRANGNKDRADEKIKHSYSRVGWKYNDFPPIVGTDGKIRDGRTRIRAAILAGEEWIPVAIFVFQEDETVDDFVANLSEGFVANDGLVNRPTTFEDLSEGGVAAIKSGAIMHEKTAIYDLVYNEFEAERFISEKEIPNLVDDIFERVVKGEDAVIQLERKEVIAYLKKSPDIPNNVCWPDEPCLPGHAKLEIYSTPSNTNQARLWSKIARNIPEETLIVFYTSCKVPSKIKKGYTDMLKYVDDRYDECFDIVNKTYAASGLAINIQAPKDRKYRVLGVYPQLPFDDTHKTMRRLFKIIRLEDY